MKKLTAGIALMLFLWLLPAAAQAANTLIPVGQVVGLELRDTCVTVAAFDEKLGAAAQKAGVRVGDRIMKVDGKAVTCAEDLRKALTASGGSVEVTLERSGKELKVKLSPEITTDGPKLGIYLRQGVTGIGTVTYYDPETGKFGTLGHGVTDSKGKLTPLVDGSIYSARVMTVKKGVSGQPGQLMGSLESRTAVGTLTANKAQGVFGTSGSGWEGEALEVGQAHTGKATIRSTVAGNTVGEYTVEILKLYAKSRTNGRNMLIKVTDPALLEATGGIVQGMSGSPIIQDGKLVGAVTHVLVNDPTTGYGIFIENMLSAAA